MIAPEESGFFKKPHFSDSDINTSYHDFRLLHESERGFARIFSARREGRLFIVKTLREPFRDDSVALAQLRKEYDAGYAVDSRYVARTFDFLNIPELGNAIVIEFCSGSSLADIIDAGEKLEAPDVEAILLSLCRAIDDIHSCGLLHRDIKPSNIIYSRITRTLKLIDLGCADSDAFYALRVAAGTERYTPPEVLSQEHNQDIHSDYYGAGMTLMQLAQIVPDSIRTALEKTAAAMINGVVASCEDAQKCWNHFRMGAAKRFLSSKTAIYVFAALTLLLLYTATGIFPYPGKEKQPAETSKAPTVADLATTSDPVSTDTVARAAMPSTASAPPSAASQISTTNPQSTEPQPAETAPTSSNTYTPPSCAGNETANEYGVYPSEAIFLANFSRNEIDKFVVERADREFIECYNGYITKSLSPQGMKRARQRISDYRLIAADVWKDTKAKFPEADRNRVYGLVKERTKMNYFAQNCDKNIK